jgi:hypothetical protein
MATEKLHEPKTRNFHQSQQPRMTPLQGKGRKSKPLSYKERATLAGNRYRSMERGLFLLRLPENCCKNQAFCVTHQASHCDNRLSRGITRLVLMPTPLCIGSSTLTFLRASYAISHKIGVMNI